MSLLFAPAFSTAMTTNHPELVTAARTLLQWARTRQTVWRDPSSDLIAALGNRYQNFIDEKPEPARPIVPPPVPSFAPVPQAPVVAAPPPPPPPLPMPVAAPRPMIPSDPVVESRPSIIPPPRPVPKPVWRAPVAEARRAEPRSASQPQSKSGWLLKIMAAAAVVIAALAAPAVWRHYQPRPIPATAPETGTVSLESTPPGSTVLVDGVEQGATPLTLELRPGVHALEFRYRKNVRSQDVTVAAGGQVTSSVDWTRRNRSRAQPKSDQPASSAGEKKEEVETTPVTPAGASAEPAAAPNAPQ